MDNDGDGISNNADSDDDGDGISDTADAFPLDSTRFIDASHDGVLVELSLFDNAAIDDAWEHRWLGYEEYIIGEGRYFEGRDDWGLETCSLLSLQVADDADNGSVLEVLQLPYEGQGGGSLYITEKIEGSSADLSYLNKGFIKFDIKIIEGPSDQKFFVGLYGEPVSNGRSTGWLEFQVAEKDEWINIALPLEDFFSQDVQYPFSGDLTKIYWSFMLNHWGGLDEILRYRVDNVSWVSRR